MAVATDMREVLRAHHARRDLAWALRVTGRVLLTAGMLVAGFVAYQLVVTDIRAERAQTGLTAEFRERASLVAPVEVPYRPDFDLPVSPFVPDGRFPVAGGGPVDVVSEVQDSGGTPLEVIAPAVSLSEPLPGKGDALGHIVIESAGVDWMVVEGVARSQVRTGTGHMPGRHSRGSRGPQ